MKLSLSYFLLVAVLLLVGCTSEVVQDNSTGGTLDQSGKIGTSSYEQCLDKCSSGAGSGEYCEDGCRFEQAENTKDTKYCDELDQEESIPECYGTVAIAVGDIKICDKLADQEDRNHCVSAFSPR
jgi:hypothetical protein